MASYNYMMSADEVAQELNCSKSHAYKLVKAMNKELSAQGYITMAGRIPKAFWAKKMYGYGILPAIVIYPCADNSLFIAFTSL